MSSAAERPDPPAPHPLPRLGILGRSFFPRQSLHGDRVPALIGAIHRPEIPLSPADVPRKGHWPRIPVEIHEVTGFFMAQRLLSYRAGRKKRGRTMKRQRLLVAATVIGLSAPFLASISEPAQAQSRYESAPYHRDDNSWNRGYPSYPRMQAMRRVRWLAENVERAAIRLEQVTFIRRSSLSWRERRALNRVQALTAAASHFRAQVQSYPRNPGHTQADFEKLVRAFYYAGQALDEVDATGRARADFEVLRSRMDELMRNYGGPSRWTRYDTHRFYVR